MVTLLHAIIKGHRFLLSSGSPSSIDLESFTGSSIWHQMREERRICGRFLEAWSSLTLHTPIISTHFPLARTQSHNHFAMRETGKYSLAERKREQGWWTTSQPLPHGTSMKPRQFQRANHADLGCCTFLEENYAVVLVILASLCLVMKWGLGVHAI